VQVSASDVLTDASTDTGGNFSDEIWTITVPLFISGFLREMCDLIVNTDNLGPQTYSVDHHKALSL
jgi:hypothetical protein